MDKQNLTAETVKQKQSPWISAGVKIIITCACLWYVSRKIDWTLTLKLLVDSDKAWLVGAVLLFIFSKIVSAFRLNIYFKNIGIVLAQISNLKLYWLGMFYNLFLPGGIGGDAYKVLLLSRRKMQSVKKLSAAVLLDRISGVVGLAFLLVVYYFLIYKGEQYSWWVVAGILPGLISYYLLVKLVFPSFLSSFKITLVPGILVQALQVLCVYCIMASIAIDQNHNQFILLFLLSSVVAILPFTVGGLGARELVFLWGSKQFGLDLHQSIYISLLFYLITVLVSLAGVRWVYKEPLQT